MRLLARDQQLGDAVVHAIVHGVVIVRRPAGG
jgi:hypothetical protein